MQTCSGLSKGAVQILVSLSRIALLHVQSSRPEATNTLGTGIVTNVVLETKPEYKLWHRIIAYAPHDTDQVVSAVVETELRMKSDPRVCLYLTLQTEGPLVILLYQGEAPDSSVFSAFDGIAAAAEPVPSAMGTQLTMTRLIDMSGPARQVHAAKWPIILQATDNDTSRMFGCMVGVRPDAKLYTRLQQILRQIASTVPESKVVLKAVFQPLGAAAVDIGRDKKGGNCMNIPPESQSCKSQTRHLVSHQEADD
jgi:hypothetical protein